MEACVQLKREHCPLDVRFGNTNAAPFQGESTTKHGAFRAVEQQKSVKIEIFKNRKSSQQQVHVDLKQHLK